MKVRLIVLLLATRLLFVASAFAQNSNEDFIRARAAVIETTKAQEKAQKELEKLDTPAMRQARKEIEKAKKNEAKAAKKVSESLASINLSGCDPESIGLNSRVGTAYGLKKTDGNSSTAITFINKGPTPINLDSTYHGNLFKSLCSGGQLTITFEPSGANQNQNFTLTVTGRSLGSGTLTDHRSYNLYRTYNYNDIRTQSESWEIQLQR